MRKGTLRRVRGGRRGQGLLLLLLETAGTPNGRIALNESGKAIDGRAGELVAYAKALQTKGAQTWGSEFGLALSSPATRDLPACPSLECPYFHGSFWRRGCALERARHNEETHHAGALGASGLCVSAAPPHGSKAKMAWHAQLVTVLSRNARRQLTRYLAMLVLHLTLPTYGTLPGPCETCPCYACIIPTERCGSLT